MTWPWKGPGTRLEAVRTLGATGVCKELLELADEGGDHRGFYVQMGRLTVDLGQLTGGCLPGMRSPASGEILVSRPSSELPASE